MTNEMIILVDPDDNKISEIEKIKAHQYGMLHRAFSIVLFREKNNKIETLLQQRAQTKYHGGGLWTNTCCSHPHAEENIKQAALHSLKKEMGIVTELHETEKFHYIAKLDHGMTENEIDHVLIGTYSTDQISFNPEEVQDYQWMEVDKLHDELIYRPEKYTPWLKQALAIALAHYTTRIKNEKS